MAVNLCYYVNRYLTEDAKPATDIKQNKVSIVAEPCFSETGRLSLDVLEWSRRANPLYAFLNCQRTSIATARKLEIGATDTVSIIPLIYHGDAYFSCLNMTLRPDRDYALVYTDRKNIEGIMRTLGKGTHAIIGGFNPRIFGHLFNYVYHQPEAGSFQFTIVDSYGGSYRKLALEDPDKFFARYRPQMHAMIFYNVINKGKLEFDATDSRKIAAYRPV
jgi:hypothetical protein